MEKINDEELRELISNGFKPELIAFELGIPIEKINEIISDRKLEDTIANTRKKRSNKKNASKLEQIRSRYNTLYYQTYDSHIDSKEENKKKLNTLSEDQKRKVNDTITTMQSILNAMNEQSKEEKRKSADKLLEQLDKIKNLPLTTEQIEILSGILHNPILDYLSLSRKDEINKSLKTTRVNLAKKMIKAISAELEQTKDPEELEKLSRKLSSKTIRLYEKDILSISRVRFVLQQKISVTQKENSGKMQIPSDIDVIIRQLSNGTLTNVAEAEQVIKAEAIKRVKNGSTSKFALTEEQQKQVIFSQIIMALINRPEEFIIQNPDKTMQLLQTLFGGDIEQYIGTVADNLLARREIEKAKMFCNRYRPIENSVLQDKIRRIRKSIRNIEMGDLILRVIHANTSSEEVDAVLEKIETEIHRRQIDTRSIPLGKSKDGKRKIYLSDVWKEDRSKNI